jgi:hypothetical protein
LSAWERVAAVALAALDLPRRTSPVALVGAVGDTLALPCLFLSLLIIITNSLHLLAALVKAVSG